jgi:NAD(P)-dependent dehydrogenase (short-subunit alcohol dehydrogenase family)
MTQVWLSNPPNPYPIHEQKVNMSSVQNKVAIVTGGGMGIGGATARRFAQEGARVLIADVNAEAANANAERIRQAGGVAVAAQIDVSQQDDVRKMVNRAVAEWGRLDMLVNNAFGRKEPDGSALTISDVELDYALTIMVKTLVWSARYAVPHMQQSGGGSIVNIASVHGLLMAPKTFGYEAGKAAVIGATKQMAIDFGPLGIRVNAICPGHIVTERIQAYWDKVPSQLAMIEAQYPLRRAGTPDDIANAVHFLCSDEASFITGHSLVVDGGLTIQLQENFGNHMARYYRDHPDTVLPEK